MEQGVSSVYALLNQAQDLEDMDDSIYSSDVDNESSFESDKALSLGSIRIRNETAKVEKKEQALELRRLVARQALSFIKWQLVVTNVFFGGYLMGMFLVIHAPIPSEVMVGWFSSTIVEVIGILWVIARSLFPFRDRHRNRESEK